jgi:hypothetical protein
LRHAPDPRAREQRVDVVRIEIECLVEVRTRSVEELGGKAFVEERKPIESGFAERSAHPAST